MSEKYKNLNILVTGATGLIGSHLVKRLLLEDVNKIFVCSRNLEKIKNLKIKYWNNDFRIIPIKWDVIDKLNIDDCKIDILFHAAGIITSKSINQYPVDVINSNIYGLINCIKMIQNQGEGRVVVFSSATIYGAENDGERVVDEKDTDITYSLDNSSAVYSESKRMSEILAQSYYKQYGLDIVIGRLSYVYGQSIYGTKTAINEFVTKAVEGQNIILNSDTFVMRDYIYVDDAVEGLILLAYKGEKGEAYNVSSSGEMECKASVYDFARKIVEIGNNPNVILVVKNEKIINKQGIMLDNRKIKRLGFEQMYSIEDGIKDMLNSTVEEYNHAKWSTI